MDSRKIKILVIAVAVLFLIENSYALIGWVAFKAIAGPIIKEGFKLLAKLWISITGKTAIQFLEGIFDNIPSLLTTNPPLSEITSGMFFFIKIITPFYILTILILAIYILMVSHSIRGRAKAKSMLTKLIIGLVLISISPGILGILFIISENLAKALMTMGATTGIDGLREVSSSLYWMFNWLTILHRTGGVEIFALNIAIMMALVVVILLRQVMVILFGMLLPLAFFFYLFYPTKHIGKDLFVQIFVWTFMPVTWALSLVIIGIGMSAMPSYIPEFYIFIGAFFFFLGSPMLIMGVADWLSFIVLFFEILQAAPLSIGAVVIDETLK